MGSAGAGGDSVVAAPVGIELRELASGVDSLYLSGEGRLSAALLGDLQDARERARESKGSVTFPALGDGFEIEPSPLLRYPYRLEHRYGVVGLTDSAHLPAVRIQPRSDFLHAEGLMGAVAWFRERLEPACGPLALTVNRLDLYADFQGWDLDGDRRRDFVGRGTTRNTREDGEVLTGFDFGRRKTQTVLVRIYDKTAESRNKGLGHWPAVWGERYVPGERVLRVEYEFGKKGLKQFGVASVDEVLSLAPNLWAYGTEDWLRLTLPSTDATRTRWLTDPSWLEVQRTTFRGDAVGAERIDAARRAGGVDAILPALRGYMASLGAYGNCASLDETIAKAHRVLARDEQRTGVPFASRLAGKRRELRLA